MVTKRIIACLTIKDGVVVQSIRFNRYLPVGDPRVAVEFLNSWGIDEIVFLDINASKFKKEPDYQLIREISKKCFVPLTVGGGIQSVSQMKKLIRNGADKISINTAVIQNMKLIKEASEVLGAQSVIASIDAKKNKSGEYEVFINSGKTATGMGPQALAKKVAEYGAGEILLNSIDRDGSKNGYDLALITLVAKEITIPVIACGGAGSPEHFLEAFSLEKLGACAAGNFFHFSEHSVITTKAFLRQNNIDVRLDTYANYSGFEFLNKGRIKKREEKYLDMLRFEHIPKEVI